MSVFSSSRNLTRALAAAAPLLVGACGDEATSPEPSPSSVDALLNSGPGRDGLAGWNILSSEYLQPHDLDAISFEWDYFMVHADNGEFTGSIGYLIANPRDAGGLGDLLPKGGNAAIAGLFQDGSRIAEYRNFGLENASMSSTERAFEAVDDSQGHFARMTPLPAEEALLLEGRTASFEWSLHVEQDWRALSSSDAIFAPMHGTDVGTMSADETWNVNMLWPRTRVEGTVTRRDDGKQFPVSGHGYRENSWGRWAFNFGGWDFAVVSDATSGVSWAWQSYHASSVQLDYVDVGFLEDGALKLEQFHAAEGELQWEHPTWTFDSDARLCIPLTTRVVAENERYRVEAHAELRDRQVPMLSDATAATKQYVIMIQFPWVEGTITRLADGAVVATFAGQGGGEFSNARSALDSMTDAECTEWGKAFQLLDSQ